MMNRLSDNGPKMVFEELMEDQQLLNELTKMVIDSKIITMENIIGEKDQRILTNSRKDHLKTVGLKKKVYTRNLPSRRPYPIHL